MKPASLSNDRRFWRWLYASEGDDYTLHRIAEPLDISGLEGWEELVGVAMCGFKAVFAMPGVMSRMGAPRCPQCCEAVGIPAGYGAPYNDEKLAQEARER